MTEMTKALVLSRAGAALVVQTDDGNVWRLIDGLEVRRLALGEAIKLATAGAGAERILDAAKSFETFLLGPAPEEPAPE